MLIFFLQSSFSDPRTREWPMMSSPFPTLAVCLTYAYCVKVSHFSYVLYLHFIHVFFFFWAIFFILLLLFHFVVAFVMYKRLHFAPFSIPPEMVHYISYYVFIRPLLISSSFHFQYHYKYILVRIHKTNYAEICTDECPRKSEICVWHFQGFFCDFMIMLMC